MCAIILRNDASRPRCRPAQLSTAPGKAPAKPERWTRDGLPLGAHPSPRCRIYLPVITAAWHLTDSYSQWAQPLLLAGDGDGSLQLRCCTGSCQHSSRYSSPPRSLLCGVVNAHDYPLPCQGTIAFGQVQLQAGTATWQDPGWDAACA